MKICPKCGAFLEDSDSVCSICSEDVTRVAALDAPGSRPEPGAKRNTIQRAVAVLVVLALVAILAVRVAMG